ncbi:MAG TPA: hypothetical protein VMU45_01850, partial [Candidatus Eisenbacteria bacterium]|nr:hypothetical protein [Candidatus Eisenbacteria bacterium]
CCGDGYPGMVANPTILPVLVIDHVQVIATNSCTGYDDVLTDGFSGWGTSDSSIATMNSNQITGVGPGSTNAFASGTFNYNNGVSKYCTVKNSSPRNTTNVLSVTQSPQSLNMSSGDTNVPISVTIAGPSGTLAFSVGGSNNPNSSSHATVSIPGSSNPPAMGNYTISVSGSNSPSGIFGAVACVTGVCASQGTTINIPPQILIQMMQAEAGGTNTTAMTADGDVVRNRFASSLFNPPYNTYQNTIVSGQFAFSSTANGVQPELNDAVNVFTGLSGNVCNALAFWTPASTQWSNVQYAINNPSTTFPTGTGAPTYNQNTWPTSQQQILYVSSVGTQGNGAPNFLYLAQRNSTQNAAVSATCTP